MKTEFRYSSSSFHQEAKAMSEYFFNILCVCLVLYLPTNAFSTEKNVTTSSGKISLERESNGFYPNNANIQYNIQVPSGRRAVLSFTNFSIVGLMPKCTQDYLEIFIGCQEKTSIGKYCSCLLAAHKLFDIYSIDECISLTFKSDDKYAAPGFDAEYFSFPKNQSFSSTSGCSYIHQNNTGNIFTPLWPNDYPKKVSCTWTFETLINYETRIQFMDFIIEKTVFCEENVQIDDRVVVKASKSKSAISNSTDNEIIKKRLCSIHSDEKARKIFNVVVPKGYRKVFLEFINDMDNHTGPGIAAGFISYMPGLSGLESCSHLVLIPSLSPEILLSATNILFLAAFFTVASFFHIL